MEKNGERARRSPWRGDQLGWEQWEHRYKNKNKSQLPWACEWRVAVWTQDDVAPLTHCRRATTWHGSALHSSPSSPLLADELQLRAAALNFTYPPSLLSRGSACLTLTPSVATMPRAQAAHIASRTVVGTTINNNYCSNHTHQKLQPISTRGRDVVYLTPPPMLPPPHGTYRG